MRLAYWSELFAKTVDGQPGRPASFAVNALTDVLLCCTYIEIS